MTTLLILFIVAAVTGGLMWARKDSKSGLFVAHLLLGFACVEGTAHLLRMSDLAYVESIHARTNYALLLVAAILLSGLAVLGMQNNKNAARVVHAGAGLGALLVVLSISRQL
jgi:uncharacterized integral membrane protein